MTNREINQKIQLLISQIDKRKILHEVLVITFAGIFIGFLAPFGMDNIPVTLSISFWCVACLSGYLIYSPIISLGERWMNTFITSFSLRVAISALFASIIMSFVVPLISWLFFRIAIDYSSQFLPVFSKAIVIGGVLTFISIARTHF